MKKALLLSALLAWVPGVALAAPCNPNCPTCQNAINSFQKQAQETLAVAKPPNPSNQISNDTCLGDALNFSLSNMFSTNMSSLIQQLEKKIYQKVCSMAKSEIENTVSRGNSLLNFNLPANEFTSLTGMSSFTPLQLSYNANQSGGPTFSDSGSSIWNGAANNAAGQATSQVSNWYNNVLP